ncbi:MAG: hypothetical protein HOP18_02535 [Deltaproteobacteria bacterium]|nr:hypothetical protein [Deltaproteobacteria bacterium]
MKLPVLEREVLLTFLLALGLVSVNFWLQGRVGINFSDEGFLWYGAAQTVAGQVPVRDFQSYDPGRYYWIDLWSPVFGTGLVGVRLAVAVFHLGGVFLGLLVVRQVVSSWWGRGIVGILLIAWMFPYYKIFESTIAIAAVYVGVCLLECPSRRRHFLAGVFVGGATFFGRNLGLYSFLAGVLLIAFSHLRIQREAALSRLGAWGLGIGVGSLPLLLMALVLPGFAQAFLESVLWLVQLGATNLPLPVPWPWSGRHQNYVAGDRLAFLMVEVGFVVVPLFFLIAGYLLVRYPLVDRQRQSVLVASACVGVWYLQHAFSRADLAHLAQSLPPFLLGVVALPTFVGARENSWLNRLLFGGLVVLTIGPVYLASSFVRVCYLTPCVPYEVQGERLWIRPAERDLIERLRRIVLERVQPAEGIFIAPHWPTVYRVLQRPSPTWQIYFLFPERLDRQEAIIADLQKNNVRWVILGDVTLDRREDLRFRHTHSFVWLFLMRNFTPVEITGLPSGYQLLRKKD